MSGTTVPRDELNLSIPVTALLKGVLYRDTNELAWQHLLGLTNRVRDYVATIGLDVVIDDAQSFAFLRSMPEDALAERGINRLVPRHTLTRNVTLLLALVRKKLLEFDATDAGTRLVLDIAQIRQMMSPFMPTGDNEARTADKIDAAISSVVKLGFLRSLPKQDGQYEVRRVITAFVTADWLADFDRQFTRHADPAAAAQPDSIDLDDAHTDSQPELSDEESQ